MLKKTVVLALIQTASAFDQITSCEKGKHGDTLCVNALDDQKSCCMYYKAIEDDQNATGFQKSIITGLE